MGFPHPRPTLIVAGLLGLLAPGCRTPTIEVTVPYIERLTLIEPRPPAMEIDKALGDRADAYAATRPGGQAWRGWGLSMEPLLPPEAWVVTETIPFDDLKPGQVVLFTGGLGRPVAHALVQRTKRGWRTAGVREQVLDSTIVTPANYIGVVTTAFIVES